MTNTGPMHRSPPSRESGGARCETGPRPFRPARFAAGATHDRSERHAPNPMRVRRDATGWDTPATRTTDAHQPSIPPSLPPGYAPASFACRSSARFYGPRHPAGRPRHQQHQSRALVIRQTGGGSPAARPGRRVMAEHHPEPGGSLRNAVQSPSPTARRSSAMSRGIGRPLGHYSAGHDRRQRFPPCHRLRPASARCQAGEATRP